MPKRHTFLLLFACTPHFPSSPIILEGPFCKEGRPPCYFLFHLSMNSISLRARFTEPTRGNKDVLIRNIRGGGGGGGVFSVVNELEDAGGRGAAYVFTGMEQWKMDKNGTERNLFSTHPTRLRLITDPNICLSLATSVFIRY